MALGGIQAFGTGTSDGTHLEAGVEYLPWLKDECLKRSQYSPETGIETI